VLASVLPEVPGGAQALTLSGKPLYPAAPSQAALDQLAEAKTNYDANPNDADNIIWYGRRTAYTGDFRGAVEIYSEGIEKFPHDDRMYRHRGHRYISIRREFDRAIADLEQAAKLIEGKENETEPDGAPNEQNIPVSSRHGNIWYHLGLAYYLKHDWENAFRAYQNGFNAGRNDDNRVSTTHWLYMIKRRMGDEEGAAKVLDVITADMNVIENFSYHQLCLFYKGEMTVGELIGDGEDTPSGAATAYGLANWYYYTGEKEKATEDLEALVASDSWAAFGFIAAEADLASN
jgi:tetratricopeptide (TPR) repeat protein